MILKLARQYPDACHTLLDFSFQNRTEVKVRSALVGTGGVQYKCSDCSGSYVWQTDQLQYLDSNGIDQATINE